MYKQLYLQTKHEYDKQKKHIFMGGTFAKADSIRKVTVIGYNTCPYFQTAAGLAGKNFNKENVLIKKVDRKNLESEYSNFHSTIAAGNYKNKFKLYNEEQEMTSPLVIVYENDIPIMYGGCDSFKEFLGKKL